MILDLISAYPDQIQTAIEYAVAVIYLTFVVGGVFIILRRPH